MNTDQLSLILLPTLRCNADCDYCFENKSSHTMPHRQFRVLVEKLLAFMDEQSIGEATIYWQGGEVLTLEPVWYERALDTLDKLSSQRGYVIKNRIQSNLLGYSRKWNSVLDGMFGNEVGSSLDYPNLYRKVGGRRPGSFNDLWISRFRDATANGIRVSVISIPNRETFRIGAEKFYSYYVDEIGLDGFQLNTPFPGGSTNAAKKALPLDTNELSRFYTELMEVWLEKGYRKGVSISPFIEFLEYFTDESDSRACIWSKNCSDSFFCIDPRGNVSQCDCWVASYPEFHFGNIFSNQSLTEIMDSPARDRISERPVLIIRNKDCIECDYLAICHGGCPIRAYSTYGTLAEKDPYCETYKVIFARLNKAASELSSLRSRA